MIEEHAGAPRLDELDYLLQSPDDRGGALGFGLNAQPPARDLADDHGIIRVPLRHVSAE